MKKILFLVGAYLLPVATFAATNVNGQGQAIGTSGLNSTVTGLTTVVNSAIPLAIAVAVIAFIIGVIRFILANGAEDKERAKSFLLWSVIAITVILSVFGIARLLQNLFGIAPNQLQSGELPTIAPNGPYTTQP